MKNRILNLTLCIIIILSAFLIGSSLKSNIEVVNSIIALLTICCVLFYGKDKILTNKIDIFVILFTVSSTIPYIFKTYISLEQTILAIFQSISIMCAYFMVKQVKTESKNIWIENAILLGSLIIFILGIDELTTNFFRNFLTNIGILHFINGEERFIANLGYANSAAIVMAISYFISMYKRNTNKFSKIFSDFVGFFCIVGIILSASKGTIICFSVFFIIYIILIKEKEKRIDVTVNSIITAIISVIYVLIFRKFRAIENYSIIWLLLPIFGIINALLLNFSSKINKYLYKIKSKHIIIAIIVIAVIAIIVFAIGLNLKEPLTMYTTDKGSSKKSIWIENTSGNAVYNIVFDISAKTNIDDGFEIHIEEENQYDQMIESHIIKFGTYTGLNQISIFTNKDTDTIKINFLRKEKEKDAELTINKLTINDKEIGLNYKYLPTQLVNTLEKVTMSNKTVWERGVFIQDGIKLAIKYGIFGVGGNSWNYTYGTVQEYAYTTKHSHCFYTQVMIENGILGEIAVIGSIIALVCYSIKFLKKQNDIKYITILCALGGLFCHSIIDFDMSFFYIKLLAFIMIGILSSYHEDDKLKNNKVTQNITKIVLIIVAIISLIGNVKLSIAKYLANGQEKFELASNLAPYSLQIKEKELKVLPKEETQRKIKVIQEINTQEKGYDKIVLYKQANECAIYELENGNEESGINMLIKAFEILEQWENMYPLHIEKYVEACQIIRGNINQMQMWKSKTEVEDIIEKSKAKINEIIENARKNITDYKVTEMSEKDFAKEWVKLENCRN